MLKRKLLDKKFLKWGPETFDQTQFDIVLDSNAVQSFRNEYAQRTSSITVQGWADLDVVDQDTVWEKAFSEFFNNGDMVFNLDDLKSKPLPGRII